MNIIIVEIVSSSPYPILAQDVQWTLQDKTPRERIIVREVLQSELIDVKSIPIEEIYELVNAADYKISNKLLKWIEGIRGEGKYE